MTFREKWVARGMDRFVLAVPDPIDKRLEGVVVPDPTIEEFYGYSADDAPFVGGGYFGDGDDDQGDDLHNEPGEYFPVLPPGLAYRELGTDWEAIEAGDE